MDEHEGREIHHQPFSRTQYLLLAVVVLVLVMLARAEIGQALWRTFHVAPEAALALNNDAAFATEVGEFYFNASGEDRTYDIDQAEEAYMEALRLDPQNAARARYQLARIEFLRGNFGAALARINEYIATHGENPPNVFYVRGLIHGYMKNFDEAAQDFLTYLRYDGDGWYTYNDLAWLYFQDGQYETVELVAREGLRANSDNPWLQLSLGAALLNLERYDEAHNVLLRAREGAAELSEEDWRRAYPGNDPRIARQGLDEFRAAIDTNLSLVQEALSGA